MHGFLDKVNKPSFELFCLLLVLLFAAVLIGCGGGGGDDGDDTGSASQSDQGLNVPELFTFGGNSLTTETTDTGGSRTATVTDDENDTVIIVEATKTEVTLMFPDSTPPNVIALTDPLPVLPSAVALNRLAIYIAGQLLKDDSLSGLSRSGLSRGDVPGCDLSPVDIACTLSCCAEHDSCYSDNICSMWSWSGVTTSECSECNQAVVRCILDACYYVGTAQEKDTCYDAECGKYYVCDDGSCSCISPCTVEMCDNKKDDDDDGLIDCDDRDCALHSACTEICNNMIDDDGDSLIDCDDYDCHDNDACKCPLNTGACDKWGISAGLSWKYTLVEPYPYTGQYYYCEDQSGVLWTAATGGLTSAELKKKGTWDDNLKVWLGAEILTCGSGVPKVGNLFE